jgi:hypothetical protein
MNMLRAFRSLKNQTNTRDNEKEKLNFKICTVGEGKDKHEKGHKYAKRRRKYIVRTDVGERMKK